MHHYNELDPGYLNELKRPDFLLLVERCNKSFNRSTVSANATVAAAAVESGAALVAQVWRASLASNDWSLMTRMFNITRYHHRTVVHWRRQQQQQLHHQHTQ